MAKIKKFATMSVLIKHYNAQYYGAVTNTNDYPMSLKYANTNRLMSSKALGLYVRLSMLGHTFNFTKEAFTGIVKEGKDSVNSGLKELEKAGLLVTVDRRNEKGEYAGAEYHLFELPVKQEVRRLIESGAYNHIQANGEPYYLGSFPTEDAAAKEVAQDLVNEYTGEIIENSPSAENPQHLLFIKDLERIILNTSYAHKNNINETDLQDLSNLSNIVKALIKKSDIEEYKGLMLPARSVSPESEYNKALDQLENESIYNTIREYLYNFGEITKGELIRLVALAKPVAITGADSEIITYAIQIAKDKSKASPVAYIERTVADWLRRGLKTNIDVDVHLHLYKTKGKNYDIIKPTGNVITEGYYDWLSEE